MVDQIEHEGSAEQSQQLETEQWVEEAEKAPEKHKEIDGYIEEVEKTGERTAPVPTDDQGQPLVQPAQPDPVIPDDAVILPMTQEEFQIGIHEQLWASARWLAEWCGYIIKKYGSKVFFRG